MLSGRAQKLYDRIKTGAWYPAFGDKTPKAMQELIDARLVNVTGRPRTIVACYVPATGYTPYCNEIFGE